MRCHNGGAVPRQEFDKAVERRSEVSRDLCLGKSSGYTVTLGSDSDSLAEYSGTKGPGIHKHIWGMEVVKKTSELDVKGGIIMPCSVSGRKLHIKTRQCAITH